MPDFSKLRSPELRPQLPPQEQPETGLESAAERKVAPPAAEVPTPAVPPSPAPLPRAPQLPPRAIPPLQRAVESILEEGLAGIYQELNPAERSRFRTTGEATAARLTELIQQVRVKVNEILKLIRAWLKSIPGVNRYFLEQEAKIKADKILKLRKPR